MKTQSEIKAARDLHKLLAEACKTANAADASATLCNEDGGPVDNLPDSELAKATELHVALDFIPWREHARPLTESGRREMVVEQNTLDAIQQLAEKHGTLGEQYHIDSIDGPGYGWDVTAKAPLMAARYTNAGSMPAESSFDYVIEVSAWADAGTAEYIGVIGQPTRDELHKMLAAEVAQVHEWLDAEAKKGNMDERTNEPQVALIRQRPAADENGDFPPSHEWPVIIDNNP